LDGLSEVALINAIANTLIIPTDWLTISSYSEVGQSFPIPGFSLSVSFSCSVPLSPNDVAITLYNNYIDSLNEAFETGALKQNLLTTINIFEAVVISDAEVANIQPGGFVVLTEVPTKYPTQAESSSEEPSTVSSQFETTLNPAISILPSDSSQSPTGDVEPISEPTDIRPSSEPTDIRPSSEPTDVSQSSEPTDLGPTSEPTDPSSSADLLSSAPTSSPTSSPTTVSPSRDSSIFTSASPTASPTFTPGIDIYASCMK
jgi:hypothetical protein